MTAWWEALTAFERIFAYMAIPASLLLVIQTVLLLLGLGDNGDGDLDSDTSGLCDGTHDGAIDHADHFFDADDDADGHFEPDAGLRIFTVRGIVAFFAVFGWSGLALLRGNASAAAALFVSLLLGLIAMVLIALCMRWAMKLQSDGSVQSFNAVGHTASVYLTIPAKRRGRGKVTVTVQERLSEYDAVTDDPQPLPTGSEVLVVSLSDENVLVVRRK